jgi:hypothetical protein
MDANQFADDKDNGYLDKVKVLVSSATVTTYSMSVLDQVVLVSTSSGNNITITLPSVLAARGRIYTFRLIASASTETLTVQDLNDDAAFTSLNTTTAADTLVLYSDGFKWLELQKTGFAA